MTTFGDQVFQNGGSPIGLPTMVGAQPDPKTFYVNPTFGSDNYAGTKLSKPLSTIAEAYSRCRNNAQDTIVLSTSASHAVDSGGLTLANSRINIISADFVGRRVDQGAKITANAATDTAAFVIKNTGTRNSIIGCKVIQTSTDSAALTVFQDGGEGLLAEYCNFVFGVVDNLGGTTAHEFVSGSDSATFNRCEFGTEALLTSAARSVFLIDQVTASQEFKHNRLEKCMFLISSSEANAVLVEVSANTDVLFTNYFEACAFMASLDTAGGVAITNAVKSASSLIKGTLNFSFMGGGGAFNVTNFCAGTTAQVQTYGPVTSQQAGEAKTPA